ncbi:hypothetical protein GGF43_003783 [Coemansia sp. RSA 2618]|nr:hypothetical protein GGF43_003783 [Coemansia sp. RSA 2618]
MPKFDMNNPTLRKIQDNPRVLAAMSSAMQLLQSKGFVDPTNPKPPSFMKMMQMMGDPEIKEKFMAVQQVMKEEGVSFSPADISAFMSGAGMTPGSGGGGRDDLDMKEPTNDASEDKKGLLGRISSSFKSKS